ncbi:MAG: BlaI/MecI/CopY family transcriptional regulator [Candidatus Acidiferrales bacterium]|jgi:predicted transcriptional regulator|nr:BlaI/MecI/CopY family transcriptional regulator [Candidatus Acidoferrales bacterium]
MNEPMIRFLETRHTREERSDAQQFALGHLEVSVMEVLWSRGESSVRDVVHQLPRTLAYTTVMTTLDRLYKKDLLNRRKSERAFLYSPRLSPQEWERKRAGDLVAGFLAGPQPSRDLLISCLVEAVGQYDKALLDTLEKRIRRKRRELFRRGRS